MRNAIVCCFAALLTSVGSIAVAATFDGKTNLLCTATEVYECDPARACTTLGYEDAHDIRHLSVDFKKKTVNLDHIASGHVSRIERVETVDGKLVLQGIEDGLEDEVDGGGWTMSIDSRYGTMVFTMAGEVAAFVGFGGCTAAQ